MRDDTYSFSATVRRAVLPRLMALPAACFLAALVTDIAYARTAQMTWETFSIWLITGGLIVGGIVVAIGLFDGLVRHRWPALFETIGYALVLLLSLFNAFVHSRDAYTSVVPEGLLLSSLVAILLLVTPLFARTARDRVTAAV